MKVKYKKSIIWLVMAIIWFAITAFIYFRYIPSAPEDYVAQRLIALVVLPSLVGFYYLSMPLITYCKLDNSKISIHKKGFLQTKIKKEDLLCCRIQRKDLEFHLKDEKIVAIHLDWCVFDQAIDLIKEIQTFTDVYQGETQEIVDLSDFDILA